MSNEGVATVTNNEPTTLIDRTQFLKDNKLTDAIDIFVKRDITIEELIEFEASDLRLFATEIGLDSLQKNRFLKAIKKLKPSSTINTNVLPLKHIIVSQKEHNAISKLYDEYKNISKLTETINKSLNILNKSEIDCKNHINNCFNKLMLDIQNKRKELLQQCDEIKTKKENILINQQKLLKNYIVVINDGKQKCDQYIKNINISMNKRKQEMLSLTDSLLNHQNSSLVLLTAPKLGFNVNNNKLQSFFNSLSINDCDAPFIPKIDVLNIDNDCIVIKIIKNKHETKDILLYGIQWYKLPKSYVKTYKNKNKYSDLDDDSSDGDSDTSDTANDDDDDDYKQRKKKPVKYAIEPFENDKELVDIKWKQKEIMKSKYGIKELRTHTAYVIRVRCQNSSGWGQYTIPIKVQTLDVSDRWDLKYIGTYAEVIKNRVKQLSTSYSSTFGKRITNFKKNDLYHWRFKIINIAKNNSYWAIVIGIWKIKSRSTPPKDTYFSNQSGSIGTETNFRCGYAINVNMGTKVNPSGSSASGGQYGVKCGIGDVIDMYLDYKKATLKCSINGKDQGVAFSNIEKTKYRAVLTMSDPGAVVELL